MQSITQAVYLKALVFGMVVSDIEKLAFTLVFTKGERQRVF